MRDDVSAPAFIFRVLSIDFVKVSERQGFLCPLTGVIDLSIDRGRHIGSSGGSRWMILCRRRRLETCCL
jgi:hypothetical protein